MRFSRVIVWFVVSACGVEPAPVGDPSPEACPTWHPDADGDGFGDPGEGVVDCLEPVGRVLDDTDCDDANDETHPGAVEWCDDVDQDCDDRTDNEALDATPWMVDADGDHLGDDDTVVLACDAIPGMVTTGGDRDDSDPSRGTE